jgi:pyruvate dehydrogenase E2 component (dihydrolipoamide acetyltransferase)
MTEVTMPQLGESVTEGTITKWFKAVGEAVAMDEVLFEVSTDKVDSEVPSPVGGFLAEIRAPEGETVEVGDVIAVVSAEAPVQSAAPASPAPADDAASADAPAQPEPAQAEPAQAAPASAPAPAPAAAPVAAAAPQSATAGSTAGKLASPLVRRMVVDAGLDADAIVGTGIGGRITRSDVEAAIAAGNGASVTPARPAAAAPVGAGTATPPSARRPQPRSGVGDTVEPFNNIRRRTAEHMIRSVATSPHAMTAVEVDYENVERVRTAHQASWMAEEGFKLTYLPFISRAVLDALRDFPHLNASVGDGELVVHNYVNLAIAVDLNFEGLLAPVVHGADDMRLRAIARSVNDLAGRARSRELSADDISGGTFTLSNSGSFGTHMVIPIINQPQVAIVSTDGISRKPVVVTGSDGSEAIAIHSVGVLTMAWDHRAFDGAYAAAFLAEVRTILETRDWEAEL